MGNVPFLVYNLGIPRFLRSFVGWVGRDVVTTTKKNWLFFIIFGTKIRMRIFSSPSSSYPALDPSLDLVQLPDGPDEPDGRPQPQAQDAGEVGLRQDQQGRPVDVVVAKNLVKEKR